MTNVLKLRGKKRGLAYVNARDFLQYLATSGSQFILRNSASVLLSYSQCLCVSVLCFFLYHAVSQKRSC
jgi:hypothetical protein